MPISGKITPVQERIASAALRSGRKPDAITLMAVTKTISPERVGEAYAAGLRVFGENRVQEFAGKINALRDLHDAEWHMIGHLQTNKASKAVELFQHIDSIDSVRLARKLNDAASETKKRISALIEINIGGEEAKSGVGPGSADLENILNAAPEFASLQFLGLMMVPPYNDDPEQSRPYFQQMRRLFDQIGRRNLPAIRMEVLSMGMSHDFEVAIEEGSTCVRIGTAIFGERART
jgi:pyridoxal phosphate enzyme (YggS family)